MLLLSVGMNSGCHVFVINDEFEIGVGSHAFSKK